ncbi:MAG: (d)CMP kinase [Sphaerochaetaceae bacterium]|nr:(d)CMP kinase [Sphaerochaetaceae bacterium]NLO61616.1 (d)CMP kinase [Spirochaetales bacterium]MDD2406853.1 (d)CMP kinase [Sphaerochaetaceae bacterium]MDD3670732.1 (d)CMP kinase [Sphaerochaetaceae bacterium]MDD4260524.1 (d)CMP kinase [Sphaerochaetaceae bacterium]
MNNVQTGIVIAIDGPAGVGKSTIAHRVADALGLYFLNSGNFYRAITWKLLQLGRDPENEEQVVATAHEIDLSVKDGKVHVDGKDIEKALHTDKIDQYVAAHSAIIPVRLIVNEHLRNLARQGLNLVGEGRDLTTVVFPDATCKIFLDAEPSVRAKRRFDQQATAMTLEQLAQSIEERDNIDRNKPFGALRVASDAEYIDSSYLTIDEVYEKVLRVIFARTGIGAHGNKDQENKVEEVKEVLETQDKPQQTSDMQTMLQEEYLRSLDGIEDGQLVTGTVVQVNNEYVFVDVGYKSEGRIPIDEFSTIPAVSDEVKVIIVNKEGKGGQIVISKKRADVKERTELLKEAAEKRSPVLGKFIKVIKGGFEVDLGSDFIGFCPLSKADVQRVEDPETMIGVTDYFIIDKFHTGNKLKSVVSRREYLENKIKENKEKFFATVKIGDVVEGTVKSFTSFGAFIDLGGFDGLLHINDMSWGHVTKPKDFVKKGQTIQLRLINIDPTTQKINLSLKHMQEDPWTSFEERYHINDVVKAPVTKITSFGVFIEIENGIEGLAHISELSWTKRINNPKEILSIGDVVEAKILGYDLDKKRVSLGLKQLEENPWDTIEERYPNGKTLAKPVVKVTNSGAFINLEEGIDGFLHIDDISWTKKIRNMSEFCKEGDVIDVVVTRVDSATRHIRLGVKQLEGNPWQTLRHDYPKGSTISGVVSNVTDFGVFVRVLGDIEGLISKYNLIGPDEEFTDAVLAKFKVGDPVQAAVLEVNPNTQKLSLSIKELIRKSQQSEISKYIHDDDDSDTFTFGDLMKSREK